MLFKLHYWLITSGCCAINILIGVFMQAYTDASPREIGFLIMMMPFTALLTKPIVCSKADRNQSHRQMLIYCLFGVAFSYIPFILIPYLGPQVYVDHARICWYTFLVLKIIGDAAFVSAWTLGDALAINYAKRTGNEFCVYRIWGTISWMVFGMIIGSINETSYAPKYVPGFAVLILSCLLNILIIWSYPQEYFRIVVMSKSEQDKLVEERKRFKDGRSTRLMTNEAVRAHIKRKIVSCFKCTCCCPTEFNDSERKKSQWTKSVVVISGSQTDPHESGQKTNSLQNIQDKSSKQQQQQQHTNRNQTKTLPTTTTSTTDATISKKMQLQILWYLARRNMRVYVYLVNFIGLGLAQIGVSFFFIYLELLCSDGSCEFSRLAGLAQFFMASCETILFFYIKRVKSVLSYTDMCALAYLCTAIKWIFYGTLLRQVSPYLAVLLESLHGLNFGLWLTLVVEVSHMFACQVADIIPELIEHGIVDSNIESEKLKSSVSATMQAIMSSATDGLGRGVGALLCGLIIDVYSFETLWLVIGSQSVICFLIALIFTVAERCNYSNSKVKVVENKHISIDEITDTKLSTINNSNDFQSIQISDTNHNNSIK